MSASRPFSPRTRQETSGGDLEIEAAMIAAALWHTGQSASGHCERCQSSRRARLAMAGEARREQISRTPER